jgi:hypothetical protein
MGELSIKNIKKHPANLFVEPLLQCMKGLPFIHEEGFSKSSDMFRLLASKRVTLLKHQNIEKTAEDFSKSLTFYLFPQFNNDHYQANLSV